MMKQIKHAHLMLATVLLFSSFAQATLLYDPSPSDGYGSCFPQAKTKAGSPQVRGFHFYREEKIGFIFLSNGYEYRSKNPSYDIQFSQQRATPSGERYTALHTINLDNTEGTWATRVKESGITYHSKIRCYMDEDERPSPYEEASQPSGIVKDNFYSEPCSKNSKQCSEVDLCAYLNKNKRAKRPKNAYCSKS